MKSHDINGVSCAPDRLTVEWSDGACSEFASLWLRDNRPEDRDLHSGQRLIDIMDLPQDSRLRLGISYLLAGQKEKAIATFREAERAADIARLWIIYAGTLKE